MSDFIPTTATERGLFKVNSGVHIAGAQGFGNDWRLPESVTESAGPESDAFEAPAAGAEPVTVAPGSEGDMLYHDGENWVVLANPGPPAANDWVLRHDGTTPYWEEPGCE